MTTSGRFLNKLAYPAIFRHDVDDVVGCLGDMIESSSGGYDEGFEYYAERLARLLNDERVFQENMMKMTIPTQFTDREWRDILRKLEERLRRHEAQEDAPDKKGGDCRRTISSGGVS